jgi:hypothetical protein
MSSERQHNPSLVPPSLSAGAEILLRPGREDDLAIFSDVAVCKSKGKRGRTTDDVSIRGVLRSMTWAHELVVSSRPWDDTSQVSAHSVKTVRFKGLVFLNNKVTE